MLLLAHARSGLMHTVAADLWFMNFDKSLGTGCGKISGQSPEVVCRAFKT